MLIKLNNKPIKVEEMSDREPPDYVLLSVSTLGTLTILYLMDCIAYSFLYIHPFPFIQFIGTILNVLSKLF
jgi:hypothetical protein